jgi:hypothetical protein
LKETDISTLPFGHASETLDKTVKLLTHFFWVEAFNRTTAFL